MMAYTKQCNKCGEILPIKEFYYRKDNNEYRNECKQCCKIRAKQWVSRNRKRLNQYSRNWRINNSDKANSIGKKYRDSHKTERYITCTNWRINNRDKANEIQRRSNKKIRKTVRGNLNHRLSVAIQQSIVDNKQGRKWELLVGYTMEELREHLEKLFTDGMSWEKFVNGVIHIDHVIPVSFFTFSSPDDPDFKACWALENLQPLWAKDNLSKQDDLP